MKKCGECDRVKKSANSARVALRFDHLQHQNCQRQPLAHSGYGCALPLRLISNPLAHSGYGCPLPLCSVLANLPLSQMLQDRNFRTTRRSVLGHSPSQWRHPQHAVGVRRHPQHCPWEDPAAVQGVWSEGVPAQGVPAPQPALGALSPLGEVL